MIRFAAPALPGAARVTAYLLAAAWLRTAIEPSLGSGPSTLLFGGCLLLVMLRDRNASPVDGTRRWPWHRAGVAGLGMGLLLLTPLIGHGFSPDRPLDAFWVWGISVAAIAALEEAVVRGTLQDAWTREAGVPAGLLASALAFALIHLPRYGLAALPLDVAAGLCLAGLRVVTGRLLGCVVAHVLADWGAWFLG